MEKTVGLLISVSILILAVVLFVWFSPWVTESFAKSKIINVFEKQMEKRRRMWFQLQRLRTTHYHEAMI